MKLFTILEASWAAFQDGAQIFCRALGLNIIVSGFRSLRRLALGKGYSEPTKIAIRKNRTTALLRALIHIVPVGVALWEIIINWNTYYVGSIIRNLAYYQFGAKIHEMTAQASLGAIVFSYIRYEMLLGQGLPFGALFSGLQVSQASYLWSLEFWGSICSQQLPLRKKFTLATVVIVAITLAATVGPSSAILLIPRLEYWPAGSTDIWLNVTTQDLWPDRTNSSLVPASCSVSDASPIGAVNYECPSSEWQAIQTYLTLTNNLLPLNYESIAGPTSPHSVEVTGEQSLRRLYIDRGAPINAAPGYDPITAIATSQHAAIADALTSTGSLWRLSLSNVTNSGHGSVLDSLDAVHSITAGYYQPYTIASCEHDVIRGPGDENPVAFPPPPGSWVQMLNTTQFNDSILPGHAFEFLGISRSEILDTPGQPDQSRLRWVELPQNPFNGTAIGAIVLFPRAPENLTQEVLMCNLGAGWGASAMNTSTIFNGPQAVQSVINPDPFNSKASLPSNLKGVEMNIGTTDESALTLSNTFELPIFPQHPITITEEWASYLNPSLAYKNTTVFNSLMASNLTEVDISITARIILAGLVANGLSRIGSTSRLQGNIKTVRSSNGSLSLDGDYWFSGKGNVFEVDPVASKNWVRLHVSSTIDGYAYNTVGATPKIAISFLLAYCLFATAHIIYAGISGISSTCWDSIGEVTALAVNSTPTTALRNTCAGITELNIFKLPVRVLAKRDAEGDGEHLELVFGSVDEKTVERGTIKKNRVYGTMAALAVHEKVL